MQRDVACRRPPTTLRVRADDGVRSAGARDGGDGDGQGSHLARVADVAEVVEQRAVVEPEILEVRFVLERVDEVEDSHLIEHLECDRSIVRHGDTTTTEGERVWAAVNTRVSETSSDWRSDGGLRSAASYPPGPTCVRPTRSLVAPAPRRSRPILTSYGVRPASTVSGHVHEHSCLGVSSAQYSGQRTMPWRQRYLDERRNAVESCGRGVHSVAYRNVVQMVTRQELHRRTSVCVASHISTLGRRRGKKNLKQFGPPRGTHHGHADLREAGRDVEVIVERPLTTNHDVDRAVELSVEHREEVADPVKVRRLRGTEPTVEENVSDKREKL